MPLVSLTRAYQVLRLRPKLIFGFFYSTETEIPNNDGPTKWLVGDGVLVALEVHSSLEQYRKALVDYFLNLHVPVVLSLAHSGPKMLNSMINCMDRKCRKCKKGDITQERMWKIHTVNEYVAEEGKQPDSDTQCMQNRGSNRTRAQVPVHKNN